MDRGARRLRHHAVTEPLGKPRAQLDALTVTAEAAGHTAELEVLIVRHRASGWVSEIARKDEDALIEAHFDPESGVVTVFEGRPEFKALERAARRAGHKPARVREYLPYRMLEVEAAANAVYQWAAEQIVARRLAGELCNDPVESGGGRRPAAADRSHPHCTATAGRYAPPSRPALQSPRTSVIALARLGAISRDIVRACPTC